MLSRSCKKSLQQSLNAIFDTDITVASEDAVLYPVKTKCRSGLLYRLEVSPLTKADLHYILLSIAS